MSGAIGIDVSKASLDVAIHGDSQQKSFPNTPQGHRQLGKWLVKLTPRQVVLESTGSYDQAVVDALYEAGLPVVRMNPRQVRDFAKATGQLAKTDRLDAFVLARMGHVLELPRYAPKAQWQRRLAEWVHRRTQVVDMLVAERLRLETVHDPLLRRMARRQIRQLEQARAQLEQGIGQQVREQPELQVLRSLKGIGPIMQATLACELTELGRLSGKAIAKLVGVAPLARDSGTLRGRRTTWGGRPQVRAPLYMAALTAMRLDPHLQAFYRGLRERGKAAKVAIVAVMRKMLVILNARMRDHLAATTA